MATEPLPTDLLLLVCDALGGTHPASVRSFALVCRGWTQVARVYLHRTISFAITEKCRLEQDVEDCLDSLQRAESRSHVRRLEVSGPGPYTDPSSVISPSPGWRRTPSGDCGGSLYATSCDAKIFSLEEEVGKVARREVVPDSSWQPLAHEISQLPGLADIAWNCLQQIPLCILDVHKNLPRSRLWVNTLRFSNLHSPEPQASELKLMTSPCLHAIRVEYMTAWPSSDGRKAIYAHDDEAVRQLVAGLAPRLEKVVLSPLPPFSMPLSARKSPGMVFMSRSRYQLLHSVLYECYDLRTDFLALSVGREEHTSDELIDAIHNFLASVAPLTTLSLEKQVHRLRMKPIIENQGTSLRRLWLLQSTHYGEKPKSWKDRYLDTATVIAQLQHSCQNLEELAIPIRRSKGDRKEVGIYRAIGSLPKLHTLQLTLDCSDYSVLWAWEDPEDDGEGDWPEPPSEAHFGDFDQRLYPEKFMNQLYVRNGHIGDAFVNCAVDEALSRSVFGCISSGKPPNSTLLEHLNIKIRGSAVFSAGEGMMASVRHIVRELSRDWSLSRNVRHDRRDEILVKDTTKLSLEAKLRPQDEHYQSMSAAEEILRRMWPDLSPPEGDCWKTQWRSFPLELDP